MPEKAENDPGSLGAVCKYFAMRLGDFRKEWAELTEQDKNQIREGLRNGTYTY